MITSRLSRSATNDRGFTLLELLVVVVILALISAATLPAILPALEHREVGEASRIVQAALSGIRDSAIRANAPRGLRLLPDPSFPGPNPLAYNRMIAIEPAPEYSEGLVNIYLPAPNILNDPFYSRVFPAGNVTSTNINVPDTRIAVWEAVFSVPRPPYISGTSPAPTPNPPTNWYWNIRQGDRIRFAASGRTYTIAGPIQIGVIAGQQSGLTPQLANVERLINRGSLDANDTSFNPPNPFPVFPNGGHRPEVLYLVNGQDDDNDGWIDESFDGIDNDGDGVVDPLFNGLDDDGQNGKDDPGEAYWVRPGSGVTVPNEYEPETFIGSQFTSSFVNQRYTILRQPTISPGAKEISLPSSVVIDATTWNARDAQAQNGASAPSRSERSRLPIDPYTYYADIMVSPSGQVIPAGSGQGTMHWGSSSSLASSSPPFYHLWIAERQDVLEPLWGLRDFTTPIGGGQAATISRVPLANPNYANGFTYLLPIPTPDVAQDPDHPGINIPNPPASPGYSPPNPELVLKGERRLVSIFVRTGQIVTNEIENFSIRNADLPFYAAQLGAREAK